MNRTPVAARVGPRTLRFSPSAFFDLAPAPRGSRLRPLLDWVGAALLGIPLGPVALLAWLVVRLTSRGPGLYTQQRVGLRGRPFTIFKLRTMVDNCESITGPRWCIPGDPRVTPLGAVLRKLHIDELPQLWNVLRGDMSLIGPRPERPEFVVRLREKVPGYELRHLVKPGITGLAQVQLPPDTEVDHVELKLRYDLYYVRHRGPMLDLGILFCTGLKVLGVSMERLRALMALDSQRFEAAVPVARGRAA